MSSVISERDLFNAYYVLFDSEEEITVDILKNLQPSIVKEAYRKKALETHPDRSRALGKAEVEMNERFIEVATAYENLNSFIKDDQRYYFRGRTGVWGKSSKKPEEVNKRKDFSDHIYKGPLPKYKLLIGQFLYYSGIISWRTLISAIIWQKRQRPPIGQIALKSGILSSYEVKQILTGRRIEQSYGEKFCQYACRKGYITSVERTTLLCEQRSLERPLGDFFIEQGLLSAEEMDRMVGRLQIHNRCAFERKFGSL